MTYEEAKQAADAFNAANPVGTKVQWINGNGEHITGVVDSPAVPPAPSYEKDGSYEVRVRITSGLPMLVPLTTLLPPENSVADDPTEYGTDDRVDDTL